MKAMRTLSCLLTLALAAGCDIFLDGWGTEGTDCHDDGDCASGYKCLETDEGDICVDADTGEEGQPCAEDDLCKGDLFCMQSVCRYLEEGEACAMDEDCGAGLVCVFLDCVPICAEGDICIPDYEGRHGQPCYNGDACEEGSQCIYPDGEQDYCAAGDVGQPGSACLDVEDVGEYGLCNTGLECLDGTCVGTGELCSYCDERYTCDEGFHCVTFPGMWNMCVPEEQGMKGQSCYYHDEEEHMCEENHEEELECATFGDDHLCVPTNAGTLGEDCFMGRCRSQDLHCFMGECNGQSSTGGPCSDKSHCPYNNACDYEKAECVTGGSTDFGKECSDGNPCSGEFDSCIRFISGKNRCTKPCTGKSDCTEETGPVECIVVHELFTPEMVSTYCGLPDWNLGFGVPCSEAADCAGGYKCKSMPILGKNTAVCTAECNYETCPGDLGCCIGADGGPSYCGLGEWCGFGSSCSEDSNCEQLPFENYPHCHDLVCTTPCSSDSDCPFGTRCLGEPSYCEEYFE
ncbi:MAG: hypothetical protein JXR96_07095 [Deltaproteobacteria bacterium]|nr:hypothetical protein [Deltaproteobacteria bacterium]